MPFGETIGARMGAGSKCAAAALASKAVIMASATDSARKHGAARLLAAVAARRRHALSSYFGVWRVAATMPIVHHVCAVHGLVVNCGDGKTAPLARGRQDKKGGLV